jgi:polysaccharide export outer membrane protein
MKITKNTIVGVIALCLILCASCASVKRVHLTHLFTRESPSETELVFTTSDPVQVSNTKLDSPPCLIISFPENIVYSSEEEELVFSKGPIKRIKNEYCPTGSKSQRRLNFMLVELTQDIPYEISQDGSSIIIRLEHPDDTAASPLPEKEQAEFQAQEEEKKPLVQPGYLIGPEDILIIEVWNQPDISREVMVNHEGKITLPPIKKLGVMGMTVSQLEEVLAKALSKYLIDPIVFVTVKEYNSQRVTALGEIKTGMYTLRRRTTLVEFLGQIGGTTGNADTYHIKLIKKDGRISIHNLNDLVNDPEKSSQILVSVGDTVYVPPLEFNKVYVLGEVKNPKIVLVKGKLTVLDAITEAGGETRDAVLKSVVVIRGELGSQKGILVNLKELLKKGDISQNIELIPGDIVYVPKTFIVHIERFLRDLAYPLTWYFWYVR